MLFNLQKQTTLPIRYCFITICYERLVDHCSLGDDLGPLLRYCIFNVYLIRVRPRSVILKIHPKGSVPSERGTSDLILWVIAGGDDGVGAVEAGVKSVSAGGRRWRISLSWKVTVYKVSPIDSCWAVSLRIASSMEVGTLEESAIATRAPKWYECTGVIWFSRTRTSKEERRKVKAWFYWWYCYLHISLFILIFYNNRICHFVQLEYQDHFSCLLGTSNNHATSSLRIAGSSGSIFRRNLSGKWASKPSSLCYLLFAPLALFALLVLHRFLLLAPS